MIIKKETATMAFDKYNSGAPIRYADGEIYNYDQREFDTDVNQLKQYDGILMKREKGIGKTITVPYEKDNTRQRVFHHFQNGLDIVNYDPLNGTPFVVPVELMTMGTKDPNDPQSEEAWRAVWNDINFIDTGMAPNTNQNSDAYDGRSATNKSYSYMEKPHVKNVAPATGQNAVARSQAKPELLSSEEDALTKHRDTIKKRTVEKETESNSEAPEEEKLYNGSHATPAEYYEFINSIINGGY